MEEQTAEEQQRTEQKQAYYDFIRKAKDSREKERQAGGAGVTIPYSLDLSIIIPLYIIYYKYKRKVA